MSGKVTQTVEIAPIPVKGIAESICTLAASLKEDGHDQETIRMALRTFGDVAGESSRNRLHAEMPKLASGY